MDSDRREINDELLLNVEKKIDLLHKLENNKVKMGNEDNNEDEDEDYWSLIRPQFLQWAIKNLFLIFPFLHNSFIIWVFNYLLKLKVNEKT